MSEELILLKSHFWKEVKEDYTYDKKITDNVIFFPSVFSVGSQIQK